MFSTQGINKEVMGVVALKQNTQYERMSEYVKGKPTTSAIKCNEKPKP